MIMFNGNPYRKTNSGICGVVVEGEVAGKGTRMFEH